MLKSINFQFLLSYLGIAPFIIIIVDKLFFNYIDINIINDFVILYSLIILVFIGAINWDLGKKIPKFLIFAGFTPSLLSVFLIILYLNSYNTLFFVIFLFIAQLIIDYFIYNEKLQRGIFYFIRMPLTLLILISIIIIQLLS